MANSYHLVLLRPDRSMLIVKNLPQPEGPQRNRKPKPQLNEHAGDHGSTNSIPHQHVADAGGVRAERDSPSNHRTGFHAGIGGAFADNLSAKVARARDGAAPNSPAKLLGLNRSPRIENADTTIPPIANRRSSSLIVCLAVVKGTQAASD